MPSPTTVPGGNEPFGCASSVAAAFGASAGCNSSGLTLTPSFAVSRICVAISCADYIEKREAYASITIGKFIPATIAHLSL